MHAVGIPIASVPLSPLITLGSLVTLDTVSLLLFSSVLLLLFLYSSAESGSRTNCVSPIASRFSAAGFVFILRAGRTVVTVPSSSFSTSSSTAFVWFWDSHCARKCESDPGCTPKTTGRIIHNVDFSRIYFVVSLFSRHLEGTLQTIPALYAQDDTVLKQKSSLPAVRANV